MLNIKFSKIICLLVSVYIGFIASTPCFNKKVTVEVRNGIRLTGDGLQKPDIYVVLRLGNQTSTTRVIDSSSNPNWWETFTFDNASSDTLIIEVWDEDSGFRGDDDLLGTCVEELSQNMTPTDVTCTVQDDGLVTLQYMCK